MCKRHWLTNWQKLAKKKTKERKKKEKKLSRSSKDFLLFEIEFEVQMLIMDLTLII